VSPRPLDPDQLAAIEALVRAGRLRRTSADSRRAERFLSQCQDGLDQVNAITSSNIRYNVAYDAQVWTGMGLGLSIARAPSRRRSAYTLA